MVCFARPESGIVEPERADPPVVTTGELIDYVHASQSGRDMPARDRQLLVRLLSRSGSASVARAA